jgi:hypothetical protein
MISVMKDEYCDEAEKMQGMEMAGIRRETMAVEAFGITKPAGLVMLEGLIEKL